MLPRSVRENGLQRPAAIHFDPAPITASGRKIRNAERSPGKIYFDVMQRGAGVINEFENKSGLVKISAAGQ